MKIKEVLAHLEKRFPLHLQEDFDNCGVQCGDKEREITGALVCFEISEETIDEAIAKNANLVLSHHPLMLKRGICKIEPTHRVGRILCKALENKMVLYSLHTNLDVAKGGINDVFAEKMNLTDIKVLSEKDGNLQKLSVFVPQDYSESLQNALFKAGCGQIGNYENCAYRISGTGSFKPLDHANPFIGKVGETEYVNEDRIEMVFPSSIQKRVIDVLYQNHPYEEPAFDICQLENPAKGVGLGRVGNLPTPMTTDTFLHFVKDTFQINMLRYYGDQSQTIRRVAVCGGSGSSFIHTAQTAEADAYISGDIKYHDFHLSDNRMLILDIGHFESEHFAKQIIYNELKVFFSNFAVSLATVEKMQTKII